MTNQGMIRSRQGSFNFIYRLIDIFIIFSCLFMAAESYGLIFDIKYLSVGLTASIVFMLCAESLDLYRSWRASTALRMVLTTVAVWSLVSVLLLVVGFFAKLGSDFSRVVIGSWMLATAIFMISWRMVFRQILRSMRAKGYNSRT
ncbi:MAG TPA: undecaprenyl-phosphate glucose phosphotransferase, partial [Oceanospirillales bacterium]|nr:undecaprenyl-phosphate glucose phosphotransferase [Oceanospirillales bacterium]